ncbi:hypothetical protein BJV77DRAFT_1041292 [Russula vinacea]|nr:hypothetical protein BJV77DRAFT_1041292 [Russula vinacea]
MAAIAIEHVSTDIDRIVGKVPSTDPSVTLLHTSPLDATLPLDEDTTTPSKKKKKKKSKKSTKSKGESNVKPFTEDDEPGPLVLRISRNKHWRYISSYHGPWLQLPIELLESLLVLNLDPATFQPEPRTAPMPPPSKQQHPFSLMRDRAYPGLGDASPPDSPRLTLASLSYPPLPAPPPGKPIPPPIDPGVFRSVTTIRRLIDEASELAVRASSGMSAAALGSIRGGGSPNLHSSPWALAQNVAMSAMRIHRLRALAVQKLAAAYRADEIASSVMVMQGGSIFEDIAERVLKVGALSFSLRGRQLAESTTTGVLDELIKAYPQRLELYRTRGIVRTFRDEYSAAVKDFTHALKETRALRKARSFHRNGSHGPQSNKGKGDKRRRDDKKKSNGQAPPNGTSNADGGDTSEAETPPVHPSNAIFLVEERILKLEGISKRISGEGRRSSVYRKSAGPLGKSDGPKLQAYRGVLADDAFREQIGGLLKKSIRDHERFLAHFDALETPRPPGSSDNHDNVANADGDDIVEQAAYAFLLSEALRPVRLEPAVRTAPGYGGVVHDIHPLLVESHFSMLLCLLMLVTFPPCFARSSAPPPSSMVGGYPVEFIETLERLAGGWHIGVHLIRVHVRAQRMAMAMDTTESSPSRHPPRHLRPFCSPFARRPFFRRVTILTDSGSTLFDPLSPSTSLSALGSASASASTSTSALTLVATPSPSPAPRCTARQRTRAEQNALEKRNVSSSSSSSLSAIGDGAGRRARAKSLPINIPLHGPRVEVVLAWLLRAALSSESDVVGPC